MNKRKYVTIANILPFASSILYAYNPAVFAGGGAKTRQFLLVEAQKHFLPSGSTGHPGYAYNNT